MNDIHEHLDHDHQPPPAPDAATPEPVGVPEAVQAAAVAERRAANAAKKTPVLLRQPHPTGCRIRREGTRDPIDPCGHLEVGDSRARTAIRAGREDACHHA